VIRLLRGVLQSRGEVDTQDRVFIAHGHDDHAKEALARVLERLGVRVIILHEQASRGQTIIEKFEQHSGVDFAVVLMTPDDLGGSAAVPDHLNHRARQNVIFELGFFIAKLGRANVCALYKPNLELPSDYMGVLYIPMDSAGAWKYQLVAEMKAAGLRIDANRIA
jgi:predicted nucleotide-binding protein